ncbi:multidrug resistance-associated ABC transporter [Panaeolus papilionaceus]|nr:multidrug resistance-associated ABC transporter [Panaeolus papilionaceus]
MRFRLFNPEPAPPGFGQGKVIPERSASILSRVVFHWLDPFLDVGYTRPLEKEDFWELPEAKLTDSITRNVEQNFYTRCPPEKRPRYMRQDNDDTPVISPTSSLDEKGKDKDEPTEATSDASKNQKGKKTKSPYDESLFKAIHRTFFTRIWIAGVLKLFADTLKTTTPLVTKVFLTWLTESYIYFRLSDEQRIAAAAQGLTKPRGIGYGIGVAFALFVMQEAASLMTNHYMQVSMTTGLTVRTAIIGSIFRKSLRISGRARVNHSVGQITTMISTDATRLDRFSAFAHNLWVSPIQLAIGIGLLINNLGVSALVGLGVLLLGFPIQFVLVKVMFTQRKKGVQYTDKRVRLATEVIQGIRLIKYYAWESFYAQEIGGFRTREIQTLKVMAIARSILFALITFIPTLASVLAFITYALTGHDLNIAIIFSSLQLFNGIRFPLAFLPFVLSSLSDALVALGRIGTFLTAEDIPDAYPIDTTSPVALQVDADFVWETVGAPGSEAPGKGGKPGSGPGGKGGAQSKAGGKQGGKKSKKDSVLPSNKDDIKEKEGEEKDKEQEKPFELKDLKFVVPRGSFVGIVGRVGSGKSSVLQALVGEMRKTRGHVSFGGSVSYAPQVPWIRNATLRDNVLFGQPDDEERFREIINTCSLEHDLEVLPNGENTEIGEKGINLSGGQKARVSLARAAYSNSEIVLMDDPLSAVDAYVGKAILEDCILSGPLAKKTRILVTHALHVLDKTDYIYVMDNGIIIEQGTYEDLMANSVVFARLIADYGSLEEGSEDGEAGPDSRRKKKQDGEVEDAGPKKADAQLMQTEERNTGAVEWSVYGRYLKFGGGLFWAPVILGLLALSQAAQVGNNLFLGFWTSGTVPGFRQGDYMAVYAGLGAAQAVLVFFVTMAFTYASLVASLNLFKAALNGVLKSPTAFFDTTPMGRILSRLSKDQDTLDAELVMTIFPALNSFSSVIGTVALVFYTFPYLGIIFLPMAILYYIISVFYRHSSVETKRMDSLLRSVLYGSFSEALTGLATIRAYREQDRSIKAAEHGLDLENRAYYMTISIQRWLAVRLDIFGNILILGIGLFASGFRHSVNPAKIGVVLTYTLASEWPDMVSQFAQNEQNMNAVERILHYSELPHEGDDESPDTPPPSWPDKGLIKFSDVELAYREGLPLVLKGVSFDVRPGEKVGIIGRTGAGKSSLMQALFRMVEVHSGKIEIDGQDIRRISLDDLRKRLALVPQDSTLFLGTLRDNLDPLRTRTDAELIELLQRAWLLPKDGHPDPVAEAKFNLDATVGDEGSNYSAGEKQLLALCRALVKNSKIIVLDEATSNVDVETDAKIQRTIQREFASSTLLCIAHRLNTIAYYDRVLVMDQGKVAEYDTVLNLFDKEDSIFRSLCDEANLQRPDILRIRAEHSDSVSPFASSS